MINTIYQNAELAMAAYATLSEGLTNDPVNLERLVDQGFSPKQAEEFAARHPTIVTQYNHAQTCFDR